MTSFVKDKIFIEFSTLLKKEECILSGSTSTSTSTSTSNLFSLQSSKFFKQRLHHFLIMSSLKGERKYEVATKHQLIEEPLEPKNSFSKIEVVEQKLSFSFFSFHLPMFFHPRNLLLFKSNLLSFIFSDRCCFLFLPEVFAENFFSNMDGRWFNTRAWDSGSI